MQPSALTTSQVEHVQAYLASLAKGTGRAQPPIPAIVLGLCKHGLYLTRNFARHGIPVLAVESNFSQSSAHTRYGCKILCPDLHGVALIDTLLALKPLVPAATPIFPTNDRMVEVLLTHYSMLSDHFRLPFPEGDLLRRLVIKPALNRLASEAGLDVPRSFSIASLEELERVRDSLRFPVAVKPAMPMMSFKSRRCDDYAALTAQVEVSALLHEPLIVQEWVDGDDRAILFGAYYIARNGNCVTRYSGRKLLSYPALTGHAAATESYDIGERLDEGCRFLRGLGCWGLCSIEYKGLPPSEARFIEVTVGRCDWWIMGCGINGVNIPMAAYNDLTGASLPFDNMQTSAYIWYDIEHALPVLIENLLKRRWSLADGAKFLIRPKKDAVWDWLDPVPFLHSMPSFFLGWIAKLFRIIVRTLRTTG
jgi:D-aspartate ligase